MWPFHSCHSDNNAPFTSLVLIDDIFFSSGKPSILWYKKSQFLNETLLKHRLLFIFFSTNSNNSEEIEKHEGQFHVHQQNGCVSSENMKWAGKSVRGGNRTRRRSTMTQSNRPVTPAPISAVKWNVILFLLYDPVSSWYVLPQFLCSA